MGTRCLTHFAKNGNILCTMYRQMDGYPDGHGKELADFLSGFKVINGIGDEELEYPKVANGIGCLAAQVIAHFKTDTSHYARMNEVREHMKKELPHLMGPFQGEIKPYPERDFRVGSIYMTEAGTKDAWQDYVYTVAVKTLEPSDPNPPKPWHIKELFEINLKCETQRTVDWKTGEKKIITLFDGRPEDYDVAVINSIFEEEDND